MSKRKIIRVRDVMIDKFDIVQGRDTVSEALGKLRHFSARTMIVDKRNDDDEYGIVSFSAIAKHVLAKDRSPDRVNIYEIMTKPTLNASPNMDIRYCARMFERFGLQRAPVVHDGEIMGIISFEEMIQHLLLAKNQYYKTVSRAEVNAEESISEELSNSAEAEESD